MESRKKTLLAVLTVSFLSMVAYLVAWHGASLSELIVFLVFGLALVTFAFLGLGSTNTKESKPSIPKIVFASFAVSFALIMAVAVIAMFFIGNVAFDLFWGDHMGVLWAISAVAVSPFVYRRLQ